MSIIERIDNFITHPLTVVSTLLGLLGSMFQIPVLSALIWTLWAKAGVVFGAVSVSTSIGWLGPEIGPIAMTLAGALFLGRMLDRLWDSYRSRVNE